MSTKTTFKRVALVAVAALGLGMLSVAPSSAATVFNATYTAPTAYDTLTTSVGSGVANASAYVGAVQLDLSSADSALSTSADSATVTITANNSSATKDNTFLGALSLSLTSQATTTATIALNASAGATTEAGYNVANNGVVTLGTAQLRATILPIAAAGSASGRAWLNLDRAALGTADSGAKVKFTLTVASAGVVRTFVSYLTLTIGTKAGTAVLTPATLAGVINAGGSATSTLVQPYTNVTANTAVATSALSLGGSATGQTFSVTATATGGTVTLVRTDSVTVTPSILKNALTGDLSVTYTFTVTAPVTAAAGSTITAGGITWTVQPYTPVYNSSTLTVSLANNGYRVSSTSGGDGIAYASAATLSTAVMTVAVQQVDQNGANITAPAYAQTVSATITGKGSLAQVSGADIVVKSTSENAANGLLSGNDDVVVWSDGTSGAGTLVITVGTTVVGTYKLRFYGDAASVTAVAVYSVGNSAGGTKGSDGTPTGRTNNLDAASQTKDVSATSDPAIAVTVSDANGYAIPSSAPFVTSSKPSVVSTATRMFIDSGVSNPTAAKYSAGTFVQHFSYTTLASTSGSTSDLTFTFVNRAGVALVSPAVKIAVGGTLASATLKFDKDSYMPGELAIITATGLDSSGNKPYDYQDVSANGMLSTLAYLAPTSIYLVNGTKAKTVNAPMASGTWTITAYDVADRAYTATATVRNPSQEAADNSQAATDAAAEATDAANAATDAANAAAEAADAATAAAQDAADAVAALSTQVATYISNLRKQITALTNLVIKIQKKVKA